MIKAKIKEKSVTTELVPLGEFPSRANQFKPGESWRGNAGGRPKILTEESVTYLLEKDEKTGKTNARLVAEEMIETAKNSRRFPQGVSAFKAIREIVEPTEKEEAEATASAVHSALLNGFLRLAQMKRADAFEV